MPVARWRRCSTTPDTARTSSCPRASRWRSLQGPELPHRHRLQGEQGKVRCVCLGVGTRFAQHLQQQRAARLRGKFSATNPLTPDILVFDDKGNKKAGPLGKPTAAGGGFQPDGPAIGLAFEKGFQGGRLFATDSNQSLRTTGRNNSSRIVTVDPTTGAVTTFITGLPTGDHPAEQIAFKGDWIYWSQGQRRTPAWLATTTAGAPTSRRSLVRTLR